MNKVSVCCPSCGHVETFDGFLSYRQFQGFMFQEAPNAKAEQIKQNSEATCKACKYTYLYRLESRVVATTALGPTYQETWP